ncbi:MAG: exodeoxyribonuclease VII large subunit [Planctomycetes bacterium]|nr:exodeoxyribonuclease VII large subunit [Planctomycetota bacterium]
MARQPFNPDLARGGVGPSPAKVSGRSSLTVSQITRIIKDALEAAMPTTVHVVGQLSNVKRHTSGHLYFTLKDDNSELACVMWRSQTGKLKFSPEDGADVVVTGSISVFERGGRYQLYARKIEPRGIGAMELAFRQLCEKLKGEGLFDPQRKKTLPRYPLQIALITSPTGAAIEDMTDTLRRRFPPAKIFLYPAVVQGPDAPASIVRAFGALNRGADKLGGLDVIIVGRGGGSKEDLWAFNDESVARAIYASAIPVISAVGHEADMSIADLVADVRAATPTAAAELAVPNAADILEELNHRRAFLSRLISHQVQIRRSGLTAELRRQAYANPMAAIEARRSRVQQLAGGLRSTVISLLHQAGKKLGSLGALIGRLGPDVRYEIYRNRLQTSRQRLYHALSRKRLVVGNRAVRMGERLAYLSPEARISRQRDGVGAVGRRLRLALDTNMRTSRAKCEAMQSRLEALSHRSTLARGFSMTRLKRGNRLIRTSDDIKEGDRIVTELADGAFESRVLDSEQGELFD